MSKRSIKNAILNYSNIALFEKREKNFSSEKEISYRTSKIFKNNQIKKKILSISKSNNILFPFCQTMTSFHSLDKSSSVLPLLSFFENDNSKTKIEKNKKKSKYYLLKDNNLLNKTDKASKSEKHFYITENFHNNKIKKSFDINNIDKSLINNNNKHKVRKDLDIETLLLIRNTPNKKQYHNSCSNIKNKLKKKIKYNNFNHYPNIKTDISKNNIQPENTSKCLINCKIAKYNLYNHQGFKDFIEKTHELKLNSYTSKIKKERAIRLEEGYSNHIEYYQDTMNSLQSAKKLLNINFSNKMADYIRFLIYKKEKEIVKSSKLLQEIINYRRDIEHINADIKKMETEKNNIIKWIYFQIQLKEKKLILPSFYISIIENWSDKRITLKQSTRKDDKKERIVGKKKTVKRLSFSRFDINYNNKENNNSSSSSNIEKKEEYKRILSYSNNLIFKTPEEFFEAFSNLEMKDINLMNYNNNLYNQLFRLKMELKSMGKNDYNIEEYNQNLILKTNQLNNLKGLVEKKIHLLNDLKKNNHEFIKNKGIYNKVYKNNILIYNKIYNIFEVCKYFKNKFKNDIFNFNSNNKNKISKEKEIILMLEYIEQVIDFLITKFIFYVNKGEDNKNLIKKIKNDIEKEHKMNKTKLLKIIDSEKIRLLKEKLQKKNNKIYILNSRKLDLYDKFKISKSKKNINLESKGEPTIQDYLYEEKETA